MADRTIDWSGIASRFQEVKPGEYAQEVYTVNGVTAAVAQQNFFLSGSERLQLTVAGNFRATLSNPAGSGRNMYVVRLVFFGTGTSWANLYINPDTGLPGSAVRPKLNAIAGASTAASVAELKADTNATTALSGGIDTGIVMANGAETRTEVNLPPLVLTPGTSFGLNAAFASSADITATAFWFEENV